MSLGENILRLRTGKNLSQEELAGMLNVSRQSVSKWENNASVPELDKLVQMSKLFGVSLDALVKGIEGEAAPIEQQSRSDEDDRKPDQETAALVPPEPVSREICGGTRRVIGVVLLCFGVLAAFLLFLLGVGLFSLFYASPFLICGVICLKARHRVGLWCAWAVWICVEFYLRYATGIRWQDIMMTPIWTPQMNYIRLIFAWIMAIVPVLLIVCTAWSFRTARYPFSRRPRSYALCLAAFAVVWMISRAVPVLLVRLFQPQGEIIIGRALLFVLLCAREAGDCLAAAGLCVMLAWTVALLRERKAEKRRTAE